MCFIIYLVLLSGLNIWLILAVILTSVAGFLINQKVLEYENEYDKKEDEMAEKFRYVTKKANSVPLAKDIKIFGLYSWFDGIFKNLMKAYDGLMNKFSVLFVLSALSDALLAFLRNGIAYTYLIYLITHGSITVPEFLLYFGAFTGFSSWVTGIFSNIKELKKKGIEISGAMEYLNMDEPFRFEGGKEIEKSEDGYEISLNNVSFSYPES